jgi:SPP1 gp7 family putative phage head morphogenesis protein
VKRYAQTEADIARASVNGTLSAAGSAVEVSFYRLPRAYLAAIAKFPIQGLTLGEWFRAQAQTMSLRTKQIIQQGMIEGKGNAELVRRILAPAKAEGAVLSRRAKNEARIITRTTVNAVQNDAAMESYRNLPRSVSDRYMWMSVLDKRTSPICRANDGKVWKYDDPDAQFPPAHLQCRSSTKPLLIGDGLTFTAQQQAPTMSNYARWLTKQPASVQNEILGSTRAQWFRDGKMSLADAIDADGRVMTLAQLREKLGLEALK